MKWILLITAMGACGGHVGAPQMPPPADPLEGVAPTELLARAKTHLAAGDPIRAEQYFQVAVLAGAAEADVIPLLVRACVRGSRLRAAVQHADGYLERFPRDYQTRYVLGEILEALGETDRARRSFQIASADGAVAEADMGLARIAARAGRAKEAREHAARYLIRRPQGALARQAGALANPVVEVVSGASRRGRKRRKTRGKR